VVTVNATSVPRLRTRLRVARAERDLSQEELARAVGVSRQTISSIETGQYCPSTVLALSLARVLGEAFEDLFWLEGEGREAPARP
jgi:putative transcriptional regulator